MIVLVSFTPLEPYTFGTDQTFLYSNVDSTGKESYLATSNRTPEQTTILGALRYLALSNKGLLKTDYNYSEEELDKIAQTIGADSFSFQKTKQSFGGVHSVSPVFIYRENDNRVLIANPFHNTAIDSGYTPMTLGEKVLSSEGMISLPGSDQYEAKNGHAGGYIYIDTKEIEKDLFNSAFMTGNRKTFDSAEREKAFYRREVISLAKGFSFAVLADTEENLLPKDSIVYMGMKRSAFRVNVFPAADKGFSDNALSAADVLKEKVETSFPKTNGVNWFYALSDLCLSADWKPSSFAIVEKKSIRNIETHYREKTETFRRKRNPVQIHLAAAGSVFAEAEPKLCENDSLQMIGYNILCKIGG